MRITTSKAKRTLGRKTTHATVCMLLLAACCYGFLITPAVADDPTLVYVNPSTRTVNAAETFTLQISCTPAQPIKAFELKISFNPALLQANSVTEGTIFNGHTTFFNSGTINNNAGTIINIFSVIMGTNTVSTPGTLIAVSFTAKTLSGASVIDLYDVGITNQEAYVTVSVSDGSVTVLGENQPPVFASIQPSNTSTTVPVDLSSLSVLIRDLEGDTFSWSITTSPNIGSATATNALNGTKTCAISGLTYETTYYWYVSAQDTGSGHWTNATYWFRTQAQSTNPPPGGGGGGGIPPDDPPITDPEQNTTTPTPEKPTGPVFIERGVSYTYQSQVTQATSPVRLRFDWGDGNFSDWSEFVSTDTPVSSSHSWSSLSTFSIRVIAQDESGRNSSWSEPLNVTVSETTSEPQEPQIDIIFPENRFTNQTIQFNASVDNLPAGVVIVSYLWDFGDGATDTGINPTHSYTNPGTHMVTLTITDSMGNTYTKTFPVSIQASAEPQSQQSILSLGLIIGIILAVMLIVLLFFFREKIHTVAYSLSFRIQEHKTRRLTNKMDELSLNEDEPPSSPRFDKADDHLHSKEDEESVEQKIDSALLSRIEKEIDEM